MTHPLRSMGITPLRRYYEAVRPSPAHRYFQPHGWSRLCFFPWHRRPGSHVPYRSLVELRAAYTPDAARAVSGHRPSSSRRKGHPPVLTSPTQKHEPRTQAAGLKLTSYLTSLMRLASLVAIRALSRLTRKSAPRSWWNVPFLSMW